MADNCFLCIIGTMDRLWFHQIILLSETKASVVPKPIETPLSISESLFCPSSNLSLPPLPVEETSTDEESPSPQKQVSSESISASLQDNSINNEEEEKKESPKGRDLLGNRICSHSSSPSTQNRRHRKFRKQATCKSKLPKSMSCKTLGELELEEVKGFMDLGFIFKKDNLSPRIMSIVPGLQRLGMHQNKQENRQLMDGAKTLQHNDMEEEEENRDIMRPYLSEAWLIKRPDSPLLNLKIPRPSSAADMKKHIRFWAKTVASEIHKE